jgi:hypothetical protein
MALNVCVAWRAPASTAFRATENSASECPILTHTFLCAAKAITSIAPGKLRSDGHDADMPARRLPHPIENFDRGRDQILRRMNATAFMAEKRPFQVNA